MSETEPKPVDIQIKKHPLAVRGDVFFRCQCGNMICPRHDKISHASVSLDERGRKRYSKSLAVICGSCQREYGNDEIEELMKGGSVYSLTE